MTTVITIVAVALIGLVTICVLRKKNIKGNGKSFVNPPCKPNKPHDDIPQQTTPFVDNTK